MTTKTIFQILMENPVGGRREPAPAPLNEAPAAPKRTRAPRPPQVVTGVVDARELTDADLRTRATQLGLEWPGEVPQQSAGGLPARPGSPEAYAQSVAERESRRAVWRAGETRRREQQRYERQRAEQLGAGKIDARTASRDEVQARYAQLGVPAPEAIAPPRGRELEYRDPVAHDAARKKAMNDREVAESVHRAMQRGQSVDVKRLSAGEFQALLDIRTRG